MNIKLAPKNTKAEVPMAKTLGKCIGSMLLDDERVVALDADVGLENLIGTDIIGAIPERFINVGIAEANMIGLACGLSYAGNIPFTHTFCCFAARRVLDQIFLSGSFGGGQVKMIGTMPGITAEINGGTHMAFEDLAVMRAIPQMTVVEPSDMVQGEQILKLAKNTPGMFYIRWERKGKVRFYDADSVFELGKAATLQNGKDVAIIAAGHVALCETLKASELLRHDGIDARVIDMFTIKPVDKDAVLQAVRETGCLVTVENHSVVGGLGSAVSEVMAETEAAPLQMVGIRDCFGEVGDLESLKEKYGLTALHIAESAKKAIMRRENRRG